MIQHEHKNNGQTFLFVELPFNFKDVGLNLRRDTVYCTIKALGHPNVHTDSTWHSKQLPAGEWDTTGLAGYLTEEQAAEIVEGMDVQTAGGDDYQDYYRNYEGPQEDEHWPWFTGDPDKSFASLLRSLSLPIERTIVLKKIND